GHDEEHKRAVAENSAEASRIEAHHRAQAVLNRSVEPGGVGTRRFAHEVRANHRRQRQRYHGGNRDREGESYRELAKYTAHQAGHEQQRDESGDQRYADRDHRESDLPRALDRGAERRHTFFEIAEAILDHDDGVIDHEANRDRERHERKIVDRETRHPHHRASAGERQ